MLQSKLSLHDVSMHFHSALAVPFLVTYDPESFWLVFEIH